ncbi:hypothetical protein, partial [Morganella morganii]|uniref:hypothetical protein n=1 Tax=Morganella morganii TaxID=582 RepID=UPI0013D4F000
HWDGLEEPVQVVWREAPLCVENGPVPERLDVAQAPLMRLVCTEDTATLLFHHLVMDHVALEILQHELQAFLSGTQPTLGAAVPYRNYVAQTRVGVDDHEAFFREMLGEIDEPTQVDSLGRTEQVQRALDPALSQRLRTQARQSG